MDQIEGRQQNWLNRFWGFFRRPEPDPAQAPKPVNQYRVRKRSLPNTLTALDKRRALEYWGGCCAVCGRPQGLWHTVVLDHWIPLSDPDCPGTIATNMIPLCHGNDGCNNQKHAKHPEIWLSQKMGKRKAGKKLEEIHYFFRWMENPNVERANCPYCDKPVYYSQEDDTWECNYCHSSGMLVMSYEEEA